MRVAVLVHMVGAGGIVLFFLFFFLFPETGKSTLLYEVLCTLCTLCAQTVSHDPGTETTHESDTDLAPPNPLPRRSGSAESAARNK